MAIAEHIQNPVSTRYDDIYHPRTDKRVIRKFIIYILKEMAVAKKIGNSYKTFICFRYNIN